MVENEGEFAEGNEAEVVELPDEELPDDAEQELGDVEEETGLTFMQRKVINVGWDTDVVKGMNVSIMAGEEEIRSVLNDGFATITFPNDFTGECAVTVRGSKTGEQSDTVIVK